MQPLGTKKSGNLLGQKKLCNLLGHTKSHETSQDKKNHAISRDNKNLATSPDQKKITQPLGIKNPEKYWDKKKSHQRYQIFVRTFCVCHS